jgi:hypothetical protein
MRKSVVRCQDDIVSKAGSLLTLPVALTESIQHFSQAQSWQGRLTDKKY